MASASHKQRIEMTGFTLVELIMVMVIVGILAVFVAPRFFNANAFRSRGFADQVQAVLRYAQKEAIGQHRNVCVAIAANAISLNIANLSGAASPCGPGLVLPGGSNNSISAPSGSGITISYTSANFNFDALGSTPSQQTIIVSGATNNIIVEAQTGYVHSP